MPDGQHLTSIDIVKRHGLIWQMPESMSCAQLSQSLDALDDELSSYNLQNLALYRTEVLEQPMNWKFVIDGFLETYHFRFLHKNTIAPFVRSNFGLTHTYGLHTRMVVLRASYEKQVKDGEAPDAVSTNSCTAAMNRRCRPSMAISMV